MISFADWKRIAGISRFSSETSEFKAIGTAIENYGKGPSALRLTAIMTALSNWKKFKTRTKGNWATSKRTNTVTIGLLYDNPIHYLEAQIAIEGQLWAMFPTPEAGWKVGGDGENCYAYAMYCKDADKSGGDVIPGGVAGKLQGPGPNPLEYYKRLIAGVVMDGDAQDIEIRIAGTATGFDADAALPEDVRPVPPIREGTYLAVIIANKNGFHWMRRDDDGRFWTHKNGPNGVPETYTTDTQEGYPVPYTDDVVATMLASPANSRYGILDPKFHFLAYFYVPTDGMVVKRPKVMPDYDGEEWWTGDRLNAVIRDATL